MNNSKIDYDTSSMYVINHEYKYIFLLMIN